MAAVFAGFMLLIFCLHDIIQNEFTVVPGVVSATTVASGDNWYSCDKTGEGAPYVPLDQINLDNVKDLEVGWTARTGFITDGAILRRWCSCNRMQKDLAPDC